MGEETTYSATGRGGHTSQQPHPEAPGGHTSQQPHPEAPGGHTAQQPHPEAPGGHTARQPHPEDPNGLYRRQNNVDDFRTFLWNSKEKTVLGRNWLSWAKIGLFYVIFYAFLSFFFFVMMAVFYQTLDYDRPKWTGEDSSLQNVGLGFRPTTALDDTVRSITYSTSDRKSSESYVDTIDTLLKRYNTATSPDNVYTNCSFNPGEEPLRDNKACAFDVNSLGSSCSQDDRWGYDTASPCIFLKLNKVMDWLPQTIGNLSLLPAGLQQHIGNSTNQTDEMLSRHVWVWCESEEAELEQPAPGVPVYYFPYLNQRGYLSPLIPVRILNLKSDVSVKVQCRAWARNIRHRLRNRALGKVDLVFRLQSDTKTEL